MTKKHRVAIIAVIVVLAGGGLWWVVSARRARPAYDVVIVQRQDVVRAVDVTGHVKPATDVALAFDITGRIARVAADVGAYVVAGSELVALDTADLRASRQRGAAALATEEARLAGLQRGTRPEELRVNETDVENAERALGDARANLVNVQAKATGDLNDAYTDVPSTLRDAYTKTDDAVRKQTAGMFTNEATANPKLTFSTTDYQASIDAETQRRVLEGELQVWLSEILSLSSDQHSCGAALVAAVRRLDTAQVFLDRLSAALNGATALTASTLSTYRTNANTARTNVNTARTSVVSLGQTITAQRATNQNLITAAQTDVTVKENTLAAAQAKLALARAGATAEQLHAQEALVAQASANLLSADTALAKAVLRAPFSGTVTEQDARVGAAVVVGSPIMRMMSDAGLVIEANVPEVDFQGLVVGNPATVTLDAYGNDVVFRATVTAIDPAATTIEGMPTYRTTLAFTDHDPRIRSGMTANATIETGRKTGVLAVPRRATFRRDGQTYVRILREGKPVDAKVVLGLYGTEGLVEVVEGMTAGDVVIRSIQ